MNIRPFFLCLTLFTCSLLPALTVSHVTQTPVIDGTLTDAVWSSLPWQTGFTQIGTRKPAAAQTRFKYCQDGDFMYFAVECDEPAPEKIRSHHHPSSALYWQNDSVELTLIPDLQLMSFYKLIINAKGETQDRMGMDDNTNSEKYVYHNPWKSSAHIRTKILRDRWVIEAAIPLGTLNYDAKINDQWRLNVARNRWTVKPEELSSWSVLPHQSHVIPSAFNTVTVQNFHPKAFACDITTVQEKVQRSRNQLNCLITAMIHNETDGFQFYRTFCTLTDLRTGKRFFSENSLSLTSRSYDRTNFNLADVKNGDYLLVLDVCRNSRRGPLIRRRLVKHMTIDYVPLRVELKRPCYRNNIYATMPDKTIEAGIALMDFQGVPVTVELSGENFRKVKTIPKARPINKVIFDGASLKDGTYRLSVSCLQDGRKLTSSLRIRKLPYRKGEVWLDAQGIFHIDGKPFLSYGWYQHYSGQDLPYYNSVLNTARYADMKEAREKLRDHFQKRGLRSMIVPYQDLGGWHDWRWVVFKDPQTRRKNLTDAQRKKLIEFTGVIGQEDGLLGYYMADEPENRSNNPAWYEQAYEVIREADPYHPCFMTNWGIPGIRKFYKSCDILLPDCYPGYYDDGTTSKPRWAPSDYAKVSTSLRPAWQMPITCCFPRRSFDGKRGIAPTYFDQRSQIFQAFIHNVKGINIYAWFQGASHSTALLGAPAVAETVHHLRDFLIRQSISGAAWVQTSPKHPQFQLALKKYGKHYCLLAVNTSMKTLKADFQLNKQFFGKLYRESTGLPITVKDRRFSDSFLPNETKIYLTDQQLARRLSLPASIEKKIVDHQKARRKPGNLVGLGDFLDCQVFDYGQGKVPPQVPKMTASSDATVYYTKKSGSLYYLLDGLTEITAAEYGWSPGRTDKAPWLNISLPAPAPVRRVVLYSQGKNLQKGTVIVNGKSYPFHLAEADRKINISLSSEKTDQIRIVFPPYLHQKRTSVQGRLLTEVEVY